MKKKILAYSCNSVFFEYTKASFGSFCEHHSLSEWRVIFADVGLHPWQKTDLARFGEVISYPPSTIPQHFEIVYPSARARLRMLVDFVRDDIVLVYIDSDTLIFESLDELVSEFVKSDKPIAIGIEDIEEFWRLPASYSWRDHKIPEEFKNQERWRNAPMGNSGVLLAQGVKAREFGEICVSMYEKYSAQVFLAEQTIMVTLFYDRKIPYMKLPPRYNCLALEKYITHVGSGPNYVRTRPLFRGENVAIRHFAGHECKVDLDLALTSLDTDAKLLRLIKK